MKKLWVDDLRPPPSDEWVWSLESNDVLVNLLLSGPWDEMSLDHDLGGDDTSRPIVLWLCENPVFWPKVVRVHSSNPVGVEWLRGMIDRYKPEEETDE